MGSMFLTQGKPQVPTQENNQAGILVSLAVTLPSLKLSDHSLSFSPSLLLNQWKISRPRWIYYLKGQSFWTRQYSQYEASHNQIRVCRWHTKIIPVFPLSIGSVDSRKKTQYFQSQQDHFWRADQDQISQPNTSKKCHKMWINHESHKEGTCPLVPQTGLKIAFCRLMKRKNKTTPKWKKQRKPTRPHH